ncbi:MAG: YebC/PmpR family DNA-binding transcriptional regulator [Candidatus Berkelbacteria bacterium]
MSGHSKWSKIKRAKGASDVKRSASFSRLANAVIVAAKNGGGNPDSNFTLKMAIEKAKAGLMPKDNIERAIKRGTGEIAGAVIEEVMYEAIGPNGTGLLIEAATDNKNRTTPDVKNTLNKFGVKFASAGAVSYQFGKFGKILVSLVDKNIEDIELAAIDAGSENFAEEGDSLAIFTKPTELDQVHKALEAQGIKAEEVSFSWEAKDIIKLEDKAVAEKLLNLMDLLDSLDDVTGIYVNFDIPEDLITKMDN